MLGFSNFLNSVKEYYFNTQNCRFELNRNTCKYLLSLQKHAKTFELEDKTYIGIIESLGFSGLKIAVEYINRNFKRHSPADAESKHKKLIESKIAVAINEKKKLSLVQRWEILHKALPNRIDDVFYFLLRHKSFEMRNSKSIFDKRLDMLCKTLNLCEAGKELLCLLHLVYCYQTLDLLVSSVCQGMLIKYAEFGILINYPEEMVCEAISGERGLRDFGLMDSKSIEIPDEIRKYLKGLGSDNLMDIYATIDRKQPLPIENFECQKEAKFIIDLISIHKNDRPLHFLLHGMEGTGKTELARTIAASANCSLLDIGFSNIKKHIFAEENNLENAIKKFRLRALNIAEIMFRDKGNVILLIDEADVLLNGFEKGFLNQMLEDMRLPAIWISNSLFLTQRSTMRRFNYSIEFKANSPSMRQKLWENVVEKHNASDIFPPERIRTLAEKYETAPSGIELAVSNEILLAKAGKKEQVAELVLKQHSELLGMRNNYKNTQSRAPRYDESVLNVQGMEKAVHAAKCYAQCLRNKETESNCTMLLYGAPGTGKTEFAKYMARACELPFKEISYGKISSMWVGQTEKQLAAAFEEASEESTLLFIDEADSLISDRRGASHSWETTQVNEFLIQLENSKCLVICSTNFQGKLDFASNRRFHFHLKFDYLKKEGILKMAQNFFPEFEKTNWAELCQVECLAPGDFYAIYKRLQWLPKDELSAALVTKELSDAAMAKEPYGNRRIGFVQ